MALSAGDAIQGTGLAGRIAAKLKSIDSRYNVKMGPELPQAIAEAIVEAINEDMEIGDIGDTSFASIVDGNYIRRIGGIWVNV